MKKVCNCCSTRRAQRESTSSTLSGPETFVQPELNTTQLNSTQPEFNLPVKQLKSEASHAALVKVAHVVCVGLSVPLREEQQTSHLAARDRPPDLRLFPQKHPDVQVRNERPTYCKSPLQSPHFNFYFLTFLVL